MDNKKSKASAVSKFGVILILVFAVAGIGWMNWQEAAMVDESGPTVRVDVSMFSGRPNPYFNNASVQSIENKIKDLPPLVGEKLDDRLGVESYVIRLPSGTWVSVHNNGISLTNDTDKIKNGEFQDSKGLKKYLDGVRAKNGLLDGITDKPFAR
jgi:hypothetical protein